MACGRFRVRLKRFDRNYDLGQAASNARDCFCGNLVCGMTTSKEVRAVTASSGHALEILWEDGEFVLSRGVWDDEGLPLLAAMPSSAQPSPETLARLQHAYALREELDPAWAARPLRLQRHQGQLTLLMEDPGGEPLLRLTDGLGRLRRFCASPSASLQRLVRFTNAASSIRTSSRRMFW